MNLLRHPRFCVFLLALLFLTLATAGVPAPAQTTQPATPVATPANRILPSLPNGADVALIQIDGEIYGFVLESLKGRVDRAVKGGASLIVIELDTYGGYATAALNISKYIKSIPVPTVAWVNNKAYSAGILIAASCNAIVMSPSSAMGDCAPIIPGQSLEPTERAKSLSPLLAEFRDSATRGGYDFALFHAMCELGVEVYEIENPATGVHRFVDQTDYQFMVQGVSLASKHADANKSIPATQPAIAGENATTLHDESAMADGANFGTWKLVRQVHDGKSLLTVHQNEAIDFKLSRGIVKNQAELQTFLGAKSVTTVSFPMIETVAYWLTQTWVRAILIVVLLVGGYFEAHSPGFGVGGSLALVAMGLLLGAPFLVGIAEVWQLLLFIVGFGLLMLEIFVYPTVGALAAIGLLFMFLGLVLSVVPTGGSGPINLPPTEMWKQLQESILWTLIATAVSGVAFFYITRHFGHLPMVNRLILKHQPAMVLNPALARPVSGSEAIGGGSILVGATGQAISQLRPSGRAQIDGKLIDVVTVGGWIEPGARVRVVEVAGNRIVVDHAR